MTRPLAAHCTPVAAATPTPRTRGANTSAATIYGTGLTRGPRKSLLTVRSSDAVCHVVYW